MLRLLWHRGWSPEPVRQRAAYQFRSLLTLAIETSCDDTSVAVLETADNATASPAARLHFHEKITADNTEYRGVHPMKTLESHNMHLAPLVAKALCALPCSSSRGSSSRGSSLSVPSSNGWLERNKPDFIAVTRGPGLLPCLSAGLNTAKGLAVAWQVPLVGVNHMQAHALTPRLVSALESDCKHGRREPGFPFLSLLVSGGHTMLVHSKTLTHHAIFASTIDVAIGDFIDKAARHILPEEVIRSSGEVMYGRLLERFAFPNGPQEHGYFAPSTRAEELSRKASGWGWALAAPLAETRWGSESRSTEFSFSGLGSTIEAICQRREKAMTLDERVDLAREALRVAFEHLASRLIMALKQLHEAYAAAPRKIGTLVVSGGVASNQFLRQVLRSCLDTRGFAHIRLTFPPPSLCTDNAAMIAWTGTEMFEAGFESDLNCRAVRKWSIDPDAEDGGIVGADCWK
ncbi:MAG: hypothetical protein Q9181_001261 [Wetmoreana brouardii]